MRQNVDSVSPGVQGVGHDRAAGEAAGASLEFPGDELAWIGSADADEWPVARMARGAVRNFGNCHASYGQFEGVELAGTTGNRAVAAAVTLAA